jgi:hypothetical protein
VVATLHTWEPFMGGEVRVIIDYPNKHRELMDIRNVIDFVFGLNRMFTLFGLKLIWNGLIAKRL